MPITSDIQYKVDSYLVNNGYCSSKKTNKKELVELGMKKYMLDKICELSGHQDVHLTKTTPVTLHELAEFLGEIIPEDTRDESMSFLTHYVLGIAGFMQESYITWIISDDYSLIDSPRMEQDHNGKYSKLLTHRNTSYLKTFDLAMENLDQVMTKKEKRDIELVKTMNHVS